MMKPCKIPSLQFEGYRSGLVAQRSQRNSSNVKNGKTANISKSCIDLMEDQVRNTDTSLGDTLDWLAEELDGFHVIS